MSGIEAIVRDFMEARLPLSVSSYQIRCVAEEIAQAIEAQRADTPKSEFRRRRERGRQRRCAQTQIKQPENQMKDSPDKGWAMPTSVGRCASRRSAALRVEPNLRSSQAKPAAAIAGPSERFIKLSRNPDLPRPARFEPTPKSEGDIVL